MAKAKAGKVPAKNVIAQAMTQMRNKKLSPERRVEIARKAAEARWGTKPKAEPQ